MSEYPEAWRILSARPTLADKVIYSETGGEKQQSGTNTDESPEPRMLEVLNRKAISGLIRGKGFKKEEFEDN